MNTGINIQVHTKNLSTQHYQVVNRIDFYTVYHKGKRIKGNFYNALHIHHAIVSSLYNLKAKIETHELHALLNQTSTFEDISIKSNQLQIIISPNPKGSEHYKELWDKACNDPHDIPYAQSQFKATYPEWFDHQTAPNQKTNT